MLKEKIKQDLEAAIKEKKTEEASVLRMLSAAILNKEKEKRFKLFQETPDLDEKEINQKSQLDEKEVIGVISSEVKKRKEAVAGFEKGERKEMAEKEKRELEILSKYLPEQMSDQEIIQMAKKLIDELGAKEMKDMGRVIKEMMARVAGKAEGGRVSQIVKKLLSND